jgi:NADPH:quinone reductase-like Zn-dependent oxidoreductase
VFSDAGRCDVEELDVVDTGLGARGVVVRSRASLVSPGTELAIFIRHDRGFDVPDHWARYPWYPGDATVGEVVAAGADIEALLGRRVFHRMPHASAYRLPAEWVWPVPDTSTDERAAFFMLERGGVARWCRQSTVKGRRG